MRSFQQKRFLRCANRTMLLGGLLASSGGVIMSLLQDQYALGYEWGGVLLAALSVGNLLSGFSTGMLTVQRGMRNTALLLTPCAALGYLLMAFTGNPWLLVLAFGLVGVAKGCVLNTDSVLVALSAEERTRDMNLAHARFALGSLLCPLLIAALALPHWRGPMLGLTACGALLTVSYFAARLPRRASRAAGGGQWDFFRSRRFWLLTAVLFCQNCVEISVTGWMVTYFKDTGILTGTAGQFTVTVIWGAMLAARLFIALALHIKNSFRALAAMSAGCLGTYLLLMQAKGPTSALLALTLFGFAIAGVNPTTVASAGRSLSSAGVGVMLPVAGVGAILMPYVTGLVASGFGIWAGMMSVTAALAGMLVCSLLLALDKKEQGGEPVCGS
ncbi:MFS transporter [Agathobaculum sp.]|uniref:MFS transporter n=1 Tax=Agathobaculum sp. TaxID=2048138 RepID=UPI002A7FF3F5|nr:MFS transporter [Agathobaculum sp.]MDY3618011.1 MFS transporter [Agathobaculum sp.]